MRQASTAEFYAGVVGAKSPYQRLEKRNPRPYRQLAVPLQHLAGERNARRFTTAGQQLLTQFDKRFRALRRSVVPRPASVYERTTTIRDRLQELTEKRGIHRLLLLANRANNATLAWWFRCSLRCFRESIKRTSERKPHQNHKVAGVPLIPKMA